MSITQAVAHAVILRGEATVDDILPDLDCTRDQALRALRNAKDLGLIGHDGWTGPSHGGSKPSTYRAIRNTPVRRVSTVFELGARL